MYCGDWELGRFYCNRKIYTIAKLIRFSFVICLPFFENGMVLFYREIWPLIEARVAVSLKDIYIKTSKSYDS